MAAVTGDAWLVDASASGAAAEKPRARLLSCLPIALPRCMVPIKVAVSVLEQLYSG